MLIFLSGLLIFLCGLEGSKRGLQNIANSKIERIIKNVTDNFYFAIVIGIIVTGILQSSSAVSIIIISLIEANLLNFKSAMGIIMGANIGTTVTVQIISLPILSLYPYLLLTGIVFITIGFYNNKIIYIGFIIFSFGMIFSGLEIMSGYFCSPSNHELMLRILAACGENKYLGIMLGSIVTAIIQSSSAVTGITVTLAHNNLITLPVAVTISLGSNVGTCITAFLASINASKVSRSLALGHFIFNLTGIILILPLLGIFIKLVFLTGNSISRQIANAHTIFNVFNVLLFLPFIHTFISFIRRQKLWI